MRKVMAMGLAVVSLVSLAGCNSPDPGDRAVAGSVVGATAGALVGAAATGRPVGALAGAVVGGATGAVVAANTPSRRRCLQQGYDFYGNPVCVRSTYDPEVVAER